MISLGFAVQVFFTVVVDDAGVHLVGVQIDSAVEWVLSLIKSHFGSPWVRLVLSQLSDASSDDVCRFTAQTALTILPLVGNGKTDSPKEAMMSINVLHAKPGLRACFEVTSIARAR